jgi:Delta3-Delta2-enoyl-CoA isomerase
VEFLKLEKEESVVTVILNRGKVNALSEEMVDELTDCLHELGEDSRARAILLTGREKFFSFGFDIPQFLSYSRGEFTRFLTKFTDLYTYLYLYPKPVVAALNGHTIAGGCMLATACDYRIMATGKARISLNEVTFGSSVFAGSVEMLRACAGRRNAGTILSKGLMLSAEEAVDLGLVDAKTDEEELPGIAYGVAMDYAKRQGPAFESIKRLLREPVADEMKRRERDSIHEFVNIWYSEDTWRQLQQIKIRS